MIEIEYKQEFDGKIYEILDNEFNKYAEKNNIICDYKPFVLIAKDEGKFIGALTGHSYYSEIVIEDLLVFEEYRGKKIGSKLIEEVEKLYKDDKFENINLTTYGFQALEFYKKCGFKLEFTRENKENPKLNKYFLVKYLK